MTVLYAISGGTSPVNTDDDEGMSEGSQRAAGVIIPIFAGIVVLVCAIAFHITVIILYFYYFKGKKQGNSGTRPNSN